VNQPGRKQTQEQVIHRITEAFNTGDTEIIDDLVAEHDDVEKTPMPGTSRDRVGLKLKVQHVRQAFPDGRFTIEKIEQDGDTVTFTWRLEGTHRGRFIDKRPTNRRVSFRGQDRVRFENGKIVEHHSLDNKGGLLDRNALR